jgi:hypothetical protein
MTLTAMANSDAKVISVTGLEALLRIVEKLPEDERIISEIYPEIRIVKESIESLYHLGFSNQ